MGVDQTAFTAAMLDPGMKVPAGLTDPEGRNAGKRFNVYRNNVVLSLTEALITAFPSVCRRIGEGHFRALAGQFLRRHPPKSPLIMFYGDEMPDFLAGIDSLSSVGYLPDLARIDLARRQSYHAADARATDPGALQALTTEALMEARIGIAPATRVVSSPWPILSLWRQVMEGAEEAGTVPEARAEDVLIARPEHDPVLIGLPPGGAVFVTGLQARQSFAGALDAATGAAAGFDLAATLGALLSGGAITKIIGKDEG